MVEYVLVTGICLGSLLVPFGDANLSALQRLLFALRADHSGYMFMAGLPSLPRNDGTGGPIPPGGIGSGVGIGDGPGSPTSPVGESGGPFGPVPGDNGPGGDGADDGGFGSGDNPGLGGIGGGLPGDGSGPDDTGAGNSDPGENDGGIGPDGGDDGSNGGIGSGGTDPGGGNSGGEGSDDPGNGSGPGDPPGGPITNNPTDPDTPPGSGLTPPGTVSPPDGPDSPGNGQPAFCAAPDTGMGMSGFGQPSVAGAPSPVGSPVFMGAAQPTQVAATHVGNPIHVVTGNKYQQEVDLSPLPGHLGLAFVRHYNSRSRHVGPLGANWRHGFETRLLAVGDEVHLWQADGRRIDFLPDRSKVLPSGLRRYQAAQHSDGQLDVGRFGSQWRWNDGTVLDFERNGRLRSVSRQGQHLLLSYDHDDRLIRITDPQERVLHLAYDLQGRLTTITDPGQQVTAYHHDGNGNLIRVVHPDQRVRHYHYEDPQGRHRLTGISVSQGAASTDQISAPAPGQRVNTWAYDDQGRAVLSQPADPAQRVALRFANEQTRVTDARGQVSTYVTQRLGSSPDDPQTGVPIVKAIEGPGCSRCTRQGNVSYEYNDQAQVIAQTATDGTRLTYHYNSDNRLITVARQTLADPQPQVLQRYDYVASGSGNPRHALIAAVHRPSVKPDAEHITAFKYDHRERLVQITEWGFAPELDAHFDLEEADDGPSAAPVGYQPIERSTRFAYRDFQLVAVDGPRDDVDDQLTFDYNLQGQLTQVTAADGEVQNILAFDSQGRPTRVQTVGSPPIEVAYDPQGRIDTVRQGLRTVAYTYDVEGKLAAVTRPNGHTLHLDRDAQGRPQGLRDHQGNRLQLAYSAQGDIVSRSLITAGGEVLRSLGYLHDAQGRLSTVLDADGVPVSQIEHDDQDRPRALTDALGNTTQLDYGPLDQLTRLTQADGGTLDYAVPANGLRSFTDPRGNITAEAHDDFGNLRYRMSADTGLSTVDYTPAGQRIRSTDAQGQTTTYVHDAAGRVVEKTNADGTTRLTWQHGQLTHIRNADGEEQFAYDEHGQLAEHQRRIDGYRFTTRYRHDPASGQLIEKTLPDGQTLRFHYDQASGNLQAITRTNLLGALLGDTVIIGELHQQPFGPVTGYTHGNGLRSRITYDRNGRITGIAHDRVQQLDYQYDDTGRITDIRHDRSSQPEPTHHQYAYDAVGRLTQADIAQRHYRYSYDTAGNRTESDEQGQSRRYDYPEAGQGNALLRIREGQSGKDESGASGTDYQYNPTGSPQRIGNRVFTYNAEQRPTQLHINGQLSAEYRYNGFGERIKKVVYHHSKKPTVTYYLYDGNQLTAEAGEDGKITAQYLYLGHAPVAKLEGRRIYAIHSDHLGTPRAATDQDANLVWSADYSPFGKARVHNSNTITLNLRFPGQYEDEASGFHYNYFRDYDPETGRYLTSDPIGLEGGINSYLYASSNSVYLIDPLGLADYKIGAGDPLVTADQGSGRWASKPQQARTLAYKRAVQFFLDTGAPTFALGPDAVRHMEHYLNNTGTDLEIDISKMLEVEYFNRLYEEEMMLAKDFLSTLQPGCYEFTSNSVSRGNFANQDVNWFYAVGGFQYWGKGQAIVWASDNGSMNYSFDFEFKIYDRYNWDAGKGVFLPPPFGNDEFWQEFHRQGMAREYDIRGSHSVNGIRE